ERRRGVGFASLAAAKQRHACEQDGCHGNGDGQHDDDEPRVEHEARFDHREVEDAGERHGPAAERVRERGRMHPHEEVWQAYEADRGDDDEQATGHEQRGDGRLQPERDRGHSMTSPRRMNFAIADELTKLNSAISSAASKYMSLRCWMPRTSMTSIAWM